MDTGTSVSYTHLDVYKRQVNLQFYVTEKLISIVLKALRTKHSNCTIPKHSECSVANKYRELYLLSVAVSCGSGLEIGSEKGGIQ